MTYKVGPDCLSSFHSLGLSSSIPISTLTNTMTNDELNGEVPVVNEGTNGGDPAVNEFSGHAPASETKEIIKCGKLQEVLESKPWKYSLIPWC